MHQRHALTTDKIIGNPHEGGSHDPSQTTAIPAIGGNRRFPTRRWIRYKAGTLAHVVFVSVTHGGTATTDSLAHVDAGAHRLRSNYME